MNPLYGVLLAALMFAVFGILQRRATRSPSCGVDPQGCAKADDVGSCSACSEVIHETQESRHGRF